MKDSWEGLKILRRAGGLGEGAELLVPVYMESIGIHDLTAQSQNGSKRIQTDPIRVPSKQCVEPVVIESIGFRSPEFDLG